MRDQNQLIDMLGGNRDVAEEIGVDHTSVSRWRRLGIPAEHFVTVARLAKRKGIAVTAEQIARLPVARRNRTRTPAEVS